MFKLNNYTHKWILFQHYNDLLAEFERIHTSRMTVY